MLKKAIKIGLFFVACLFYTSAGIAEPTVIRDFTCGKVDTEDPTLIGEGCAQELWNVDVWRGRLQKRRGSILQNTTDLGSFSNQPVKFLHEFPDQNGNFWLISYSSNTLFKSNDGGATNSVLTSTFGITSSSEWSATNAFGRAYLTDGTTNWVIYDGNVLISSTAPPRGKLAAFMFNRIWTADVTGARSTLYYSRISDPYDWTDNDLDDGDASSLFIRQNDGYYIRALIPYKNALLVFKDYSIDAVTMGTDGLTPIVTPVSNSVGTQHRRSVVQTDNSVMFVGDDAIYDYTGSSLKVVSDGIDATVDSILQRNSTSRSYSITTQADFSQGLFKDTNGTYTPGSVVLSTWTGIDTSTGDFTQGTLVNVDTNTTPGLIQLSTNSSNVPNNSFESGSIDNWSIGGSGYTPVKSNGASAGVTPYNGSFMVEMLTDVEGKTLYIQILDGLTGTLIVETSEGSGGSTRTNSWEDLTLNASAYKGRSIILRFKVTESGGNYGTVNTDAFICSGGNIDIYYYHKYSGGNNGEFFIDNALGGRSTVGAGYFVSRAFDTGFSSAAWLASTYSYAVNGGSITVYTQSSSDGAVWGSSVPWISGSAPASVWNKYLRYQVNLTTTANSVALPTFSEAQLAACSSTGLYISSPLAIGTNITSWSQFSADVATDGGTITYAIYSDTNTTISTNTVNTWVSSQTITSGQTPTFATAPYMYIAPSFAITVATSNPMVNSLQIEWSEGSSNFPIWGTFFEHEYHAAVSTSNIANNDTILVFDSNKAWTEYIGFNPYVLARYRQGIYYGDATRGRIYRYNVDDIYSDNGVAINTRWKSKEFDFGYPTSDKTVMKYSIMAKRQVGTTVSFNYGVNRGAYTSTSLDLGSVAGAYRKFLVPNSDTYRRGVTHSFSFTNSSVDQPFDILSISIYPRLETDPL